MGKLRAFRDCLESKEEALARIVSHDDWCRIHGDLDVSCSVICLVRPFSEKDIERDIALAENDCFESEFLYAERCHGIPESLANLHDVLGDCLGRGKGADLTKRFYEAIPEGADLSDVVFNFFHWGLLHPGGVRSRAGKESMAAIEQVERLYDRRRDGKAVSAEEWWKASRAAVDSWVGKRGDSLAGKGADGAALVEFGRAKGEGQKYIAERENSAVRQLLGAWPHIVKNAKWHRRYLQEAADALVGLVKAAAVS